MSSIEYRKAYYLKHKDAIKTKMSETLVCSLCNREVSHQHMQRHRKTLACHKYRVVHYDEKDGKEVNVLINPMPEELPYSLSLSSSDDVLVSSSESS